MARIALGITLALLLATCFFGFETRSKVQDLTAQVETSKNALASANQQVATANANLRSAKDDLAKAKSAADAAQAQATQAQGDLTAAQGQVTSLTAQVKDLSDKLAAATGKPVTQETLAGPTQAEMDKLTAQLKDAQAQVAELNELKETLSGKVKDAEARADDLQKVVDHYKNSTLKNGLEGEVLAVNQGWNFVVLSIGDHQGAVANAEMILKRDGAQIGKVRITSVEPSTSVADIIPGSLARGVRVQPGDRVIFPGS